MRFAILMAFALLAVGSACENVTPQMVTVSFNTAVTQQDIDDATAFLKRYDDDLEFHIQESFPPIGSVVVETDDTRFCSKIEAKLEARPYVSDVTCRAAQRK